MRNITSSFSAFILSICTSAVFAQTSAEKYNNADFKRKGAEVRYDTSYMQMSHGDDHQKHGSLPILGVYKVYGVLSGNLSLPYSVKK